MFAGTNTPADRQFLQRSSALNILMGEDNDIEEEINTMAEASDESPRRDPAYLATLRRAVLDKNHYWYNRYRAVDGYSTFGERAFLKFTNGQSNSVTIFDLKTFAKLGEPATNGKNPDAICYEPKTKRIFAVNHGGQDVTLKDLLAVIARLTGRRPPRLRVPRRPLFPLAYAAEAIARVTGKEPFITADGLRMAKHRMFFSSAKAERELGYRARPYTSGIEDAILWFRQAGYIR